MALTLLFLFMLVVGILSGLIIPLLVVLLLQTLVLMAAVWLINGKVEFVRTFKALVTGGFVFFMAGITSAIAVVMLSPWISSTLLLAGAATATLGLTTLAFANTLKTPFWRAALIAFFYLVLSAAASWLLAPEDMQNDLQLPPATRII